MFHLDADKLLAFFSLDDRDLALAFAEMEGFSILSWDCRPCTPKPPDFGGIHGENHNGAPHQISPGVYAYRLRRSSGRHEDVMFRHEDVMFQRVLTSPNLTTRAYADAMGIPIAEVAGFLLRLRKRGLVHSRAERGKLVWAAVTTVTAMESAAE